MARRINLIPRTERPRTKTDWGLLATVGLFIVVIFGLGFGYYTFSNVLDERKQELADLEVQTTKLEQQVQALRAYELLASQREGVQSVVQSIYTSRTLLSDVLDAVSLVIPDNAWFQSLELSATDPGEAIDCLRIEQRRQHNHIGQDVQLRGHLPAGRPPAAGPGPQRCPVDPSQRRARL